MHAQEQYWSTYYADVVKTGNRWLDYSNDRVQAQTFGLTLEAAGSVGDKRCLDVGCGWGHFCRVLAALGASTVTGVDVVPEVIAHHEREYPDIRWICGSVHDPHVARRLEDCDIAFLTEVLQYVPFPSAIRAVWSRVRPGGRLVGMVPNAGCSIVSKTRARLGDSYAPLAIGDLEAELRGLTDVEHVAFRALSFALDQRLVPYDVSTWRTGGGWDVEPNRIQFVAMKRAATTA
jgi:2-polyprenyl-3-methyl-5-hydroxy-6-metoxy-1,4-benzoquinol methylase